MKKYDYKAVEKFFYVENAVDNFSMHFRNQHEDIGHGFAIAHGALHANLHMLLVRAIDCDDEILKEYATEMVERFRDIHLEENV